MKARTGRLVQTVLTFAALWGCGDEEPTLFDLYLGQLDREVQSTCHCTWEQEGFRSESACVSEWSIDASEEDCAHRLYSGREDELDPVLDCELALYRNVVVCIESASCSTPAIDACWTAFQGARSDCPAFPTDLADGFDRCF